jgi:quercetin dioxygenase-like cupin family protein
MLGFHRHWRPKHEEHPFEPVRVVEPWIAENPFRVGGLRGAGSRNSAVGILVNQILAQGVVPDNIHQQVEITRNADGSVDPWGAEVHTHGVTDTYVQHLVLAPGGYSGWHTHAGILIGTVVSGSIDFYDANCQKRTVGAGQVYFETDKVHGIINTGAAPAELYLSYLIKHNAPRRMEADAPACAASTGIP